MQGRREQRGVTQYELGKLIGGSQHQIARYESGERVPQADTLAKIARALECSADYLLGLSEKPGEQAPLLSGNLQLLLSTLSTDELDKIERFINLMFPPDEVEDKE